MVDWTISRAWATRYLIQVNKNSHATAYQRDLAWADYEKDQVANVGVGDKGRLLFHPLCTRAPTSPSASGQDTDDQEVTVTYDSCEIYL